MEYLASKLAPPALMSYFIDRPRILRRLTRSANLIVLAAPAGYGKTVLALQILQLVPPQRRAWLDLDARDDDPQRFIAYFTEALALSIPEFRLTKVREETLAGRMPLQQAAEEVSFFLQEARRPPCWMVLDNWEHVDRTPDVGRFVASILAGTRGKLKLIINSRVVPSFSIRKLQERGAALIASRKELAFTFLEFREAAARRFRIRIPENELEEIWRLTEGWCVHLGLVLDVLAGPGTGRRLERRPDADSLESLLGYVKEEILPTIPQDLLDFLIHCSPLESLSLPACAILVQDEDRVTRSLKALRESSIPFFSLSEPAAVRLHPLMREAASRLLRERISPEEVRTLYRKVGAYQIDQGLVLEGIRTLLDASDHEAALDAIHRHWFRIVEVGGQVRVERWLEAFPEEWRKSPKYVITMTNVLSLRGDNDRLLQYLSDKVAADSFPDDDQALANSWMHYNWAWLHESDEPRYDAVARSWKSIAEKRGPFPPIVLAGIENIQGYAALLQLDLEQAQAHYRRSLEHQGQASFDYAITTRNNIALCQYMQGDAARALAEFHRCAAECLERSSPSMLPMVMINIAEVYYAAGRFQESLTAIQKCLDIMQAHNIAHPFIEMAVDKIRGLCAWHQGHRERAWLHLREALRASERSSPTDRLGVALVAEYLSMLDERPLPNIHGVSMPGAGRRSENRLAYLAVEAWRAIAKGDAGTAESLLAELSYAAESAGCKPWSVTGHVLSAFHSDAQGGAAACRRHLSEALLLLGEIGWQSYPMANPRLTAFVQARAIRWNLMTQVASRLGVTTNVVERSAAFRAELQSAASRPTEIMRLVEAATQERVRGLTDHAIRLSKARNANVAARARRYLEATRQQDLPPLEINLLGGFGVTAGGAAIVITRKKSRLLLQMLLISHPSPVHEETILETLWPQARPDMGRAALQTAAKDLRRALDPHHEARGKSYVAFSDSCYGLYLPTGSVCDAHEFDESVRRALSLTAAKGRLGEADEALLRGALAHFGGEALPDLRLESFAQEFREHLHRRFLDASLRLARSLNSRRKHAEAIRAIERGLSIDSLWGEGVHELMLAHARNGELCRALRVYREYERRLRAELNLAPDVQMTRQFEDLLRIP